MYWHHYPECISMLSTKEASVSHFCVIVLWKWIFSIATLIPWSRWKSSFYDTITKETKGSNRLLLLSLDINPLTMIKVHVRSRVLFLKTHLQGAFCHTCNSFGEYLYKELEEQNRVNVRLRATNELERGTWAKDIVNKRFYIVNCVEMVWISKNICRTLEAKFNSAKYRNKCLFHPLSSIPSNDKGCESTTLHC